MTWTLHLGSCLDPVTGLASLPDKSVDHVITDPPYSEHVHNGSRAGSRLTDGFSRDVNFGFAHIEQWQRDVLGSQIARASRRWALIFCDVESGHLWRSSVEAAGMDFVRTGIWEKIGCTPQFSGDRPAIAVEAIVISHPRGRKRWNGGGRRGLWRHEIVRDAGTQRGEPRVHTTQKPLDLMLELIADFTDPGDTVLDPFAGSGTTGVACNMLGRHFIGWELSPDYHAIATRRLSGDEAKPRPEQPSLFGRLA